MKGTKLIGVILLVLGVLAFVYQGISYTTTEQVVDLGPVEIETQDTETIPLPPIIGGLLVVGGVALIFMARD